MGGDILHAHPAWGIVIDDEENIYFADIFHNGRGSVWKLYKDGKLELLLSDFHAHNVSLDTEGNLVTAHGEGHHTMVRMLGNKVSDTLYTSRSFEEFNGGNCTYALNGDIIFGISNHLWRIDNNGVKSKLSEFRFEWNQTVYSDTEGNYYAPDIGRDNGAVIKIDPDGNAQVIATDLIAKLGYREYDPTQDVLLGIGKDEQGWMYIAETAGKRIIRFSEEGEKETFYRSEGDWFPCGITFHNGAAYILESKMDNGYEGPRITKLLKDGTYEIIFNYDTHKNPISAEPNKEEEKEVNLIWFYIGLIGIVVFVLLIYRKLQIPTQHLTKNS